jgi:hypothetical protein
VSVTSSGAPILVLGQGRRLPQRRSGPCGFELGHLATDQELFCGVCLKEGRALILLERWLADDETPIYALLRVGLAA